MNNGYAGFAHMEEGLLFAALGTSKGAGIYRFEPSTGQALQEPFIAAQGYVDKFLPLED